jgi:hypothetical protein
MLHKIYAAFVEAGIVGLYRVVVFTLGIEDFA